MVALALVAGFLLLLTALRSRWFRIQRVPSRPRLPWQRRDSVRIEGAARELLDSRWPELAVDDELMGLARVLAFERASTAQPGPIGELRSVDLGEIHCPGFGGTIELLESSEEGTPLEGEEDMAERLVGALPEASAASPSHWGVGAAQIGEQTRLVVAVGRLAWRWSTRPPAHGDPGYPIAGEGEVADPRWTPLSLVGEGGDVAVIDAQDAPGGGLRFRFDLPQLNGAHRIEAGPVDDRVLVARLWVGPTSS
jgi:hypothetical protein